MEIILKEDVINLGYKNDIVKVKNGYGRNFLIPTGKAIVATPSAKKGIIVFLALKAISTSLITCSDSLESCVNTNNKISAEFIPFIIALAYGAPGWILRGAIQHFIPLFSKAQHTSSAISLSFVE